MGKLSNQALTEIILFSFNAFSQHATKISTNKLICNKIKFNIKIEFILEQLQNTVIFVKTIFDNNFKTELPFQFL